MCSQITSHNDAKLCRLYTDNFSSDWDSLMIEVLCFNNNYCALIFKGALASLAEPFMTETFSHWLLCFLKTFICLVWPESHLIHRSIDMYDLRSDLTSDPTSDPTSNSTSDLTSQSHIFSFVQCSSLSQRIYVLLICWMKKPQQFLIALLGLTFGYFVIAFLRSVTGQHSPPYLVNTQVLCKYIQGCVRVRPACQVRPI